MTSHPIKITVYLLSFVLLANCKGADTSVPSKTGISDATCKTLHYPVDKDQYDYWQKVFDKNYRNFVLHDVGSVCRIDGATFVTFSYFNNSDTEEILTVLDQDQNILRQSTNLDCETWGDQPPILIDTFTSRKIEAHCHSGDAGSYITEYFSIDPDTLEWTRTHVDTNSPTYNSNN